MVAIGAIVLVLLSVVLVHEGGHFLLAKLSGVRVDEFAVGFGPRLAAKRFGETVYSLRVIPAGGYVKMAGMLGLEGEADAGERNFYRASIPKRMATLLAGIVANMVFAGLCFTVYDTTSTSSQVLAGGAAQRAGLHDGDAIQSVDGRAIRHDTAAAVAADLHAATAASQGRPMQVVYRGSDGAMHTSTISPSLVVVNGITPPAAPSGAAGQPSPAGPLPLGTFQVTSVDDRPVGTGDPASLLGAGGTVRVSGFVGNPDGSRGTAYTDVTLSNVRDGDGAAGALQAAWRLGVSPNFDGEPLGTALRDGFAALPAFIGDTVGGLRDLISNPNSGGITGPNGLSGPVGIAQQTITQAHRGSKSLLYWIGFISMNLGFINVLPIPFLDGGKFFLIVVEAVRRRRLDPRREALIYAVGLAIVVVFAIYVTIGDVRRSL